MTDFRDFIAERLKNEELKNKYDTPAPELAIMQTVLNARKEAGLTQKELSERSGISQSDISKIENGYSNPSIKTLQRLAEAVGRTLKIEFI